MKKDILEMQKVHLGNIINERKDGIGKERNCGTPQGGVISPLLSNIFMHYAFDNWMQTQFPSIKFERFADDAVVHCKTQKQAKMILEEPKINYSLRKRLKKRKSSN